MCAIERRFSKTKDPVLTLHSRFWEKKIRGDPVLGVLFSKQFCDLAKVTVIYKLI
jgi:hypothetical protein